MKNNGLQNRFPSGTRNHWIGHYSCMVCGMNHWDTLHHIVSPNSKFYIPGDHNTSTLNSSPVHNFAHPDMINTMQESHYCHFGNETFLLKEVTIAILLQKTFRALLSLGYQLTEKDNQFLVAYSKFYLRELKESELMTFARRTVDKPVDNVYKSLV